MKSTRPAVLLFFAYVCLSTMLNGCGKQSTQEPEKNLDEQIAAKKEDVAVAEAADRGLRPDSDMQRVANEKVDNLQGELNQLEMQKEDVAQGQNKKYADSVKNAVNKLPQPDAQLVAWIGKCKTNENSYGDGIRGLLNQHWIGTNTSGTFIGLNPYNSLVMDGRLMQEFGMSDGNTLDDVQQGKNIVDANDDIIINGLPYESGFTIDNYKIGQDKEGLKGVLLSTNIMRIYFPNNTLGTVDFYPMQDNH